MNSEELKQYLINQGLMPQEATFVIITYKLNSPFKKQEYNANEWIVDTVGSPEEILKDMVETHCDWASIANYIESTGYAEFAKWLSIQEDTCLKFLYIDETERLIVWKGGDSEPDESFEDVSEDTSEDSSDEVE